MGLLLAAMPATAAAQLDETEKGASPASTAEATGETPSAPAEPEAQALPAPGTGSPAATAETAPLNLSWKDGKTTFETENVRIQLSNRVQLRFTENPGLGVLPEGFFELRRAKTKLEGWLYSPDLTYTLQLNWADSLNPLEDALLDYDVSGSGHLRVTLGQYKVPFGRQELTSSGSQQFVDRSIVSKAFARGRDVGVQLHGKLHGGVVQWAAGVFNGNGRTRTRLAGDRYQVNARLQLAPNGDPKYSEADLESSDRPLYAVAVGYQRIDLDDSELDRTLRTTWAVDGVFKYRGLSLFAEAFFARNGVAHSEEALRRPSGVHAQVGQFVVGRRLELSGRFGWLDPDRAVAADGLTEMGGALSYYFRKHGLKAQADVRRLENHGSDAVETQLRFQAQFVF